MSQRTTSSVDKMVKRCDPTRNRDCSELDPGETQQRYCNTKVLNGEKQNHAWGQQYNTATASRGPHARSYAGNLQVPVRQCLRMIRCGWRGLQLERPATRRRSKRSNVVGCDRASKASRSTAVLIRSPVWRGAAKHGVGSRGTRSSDIISPAGDACRP